MNELELDPVEALASTRCHDAVARSQPLERSLRRPQVHKRSKRLPRPKPQRQTRNRISSAKSQPAQDPGDWGGVWCHHFARAAHFVSVERPLGPPKAVRRTGGRPTRKHKPHQAQHIRSSQDRLTVSEALQRQACTAPGQAQHIHSTTGQVLALN